ncbi:MAG: M15 family metallopeptidase [Bacillota bacterium]|nr:M15 family metallopeptidase [Bacillota bacterium]
MSKKWTWVLAIFAIAVLGFFIFRFATAGTAPTMKTVNAVSGETSITLSGLIEEDGGKALSKVGFRWGTSRELEEYELFNGPTEEGAAFSVMLGNLEDGTTYFYQSYAVNEKGTGYGEIQSVTTAEKPNQPPSVTVTSPSNHITVTQGTAVKISAVGEDDEKVENMVLFINNTAKLHQEGNTLDYDWYTEGFDPGSYEIKVTAGDGQEETEALISLVIKEKVVVPTPKTATDSSQQAAVKETQQSSTTVSRASKTDRSKYSKLGKIQGSYGSFWYRDTSGGRIEIDPNWVSENIVTITLPGLNQKVQVHKDAADNFIQAFTYIKNGTANINGKQVPLLSLIDSMDGTFVTRHVMWNASRGLSRHSWGIAIDINAAGHFGYIDPAKHPNDPNLILWEKAFEPAGFSWGNRYSDSMHFEMMD